MSASSEIQKVCVKCGVDCANKPRTKDSQGRYYCQPCYDAAKKQRVAAAPVPKPFPKKAIRDELAIVSHADDRPVNLLDQLIASAPPPITAAPCPACGIAIQGGAVICTNCGFNTQTHHSIRAPKVYRAPREATGGVVWPPLVGIVSIIFGAGGLLLYGASLCLTLIAAVNAGNLLGMVFAVAPSLLMTSLAAWLLRDGLRILRRDSSGVTWIRGWAAVKLLLVTSCFGALMMIPNESFTKTRAGQANALPIDPVAIKATIGAYYAFYAFWPAFILTFFFVPKIMRDVKTWN
jgi:hypothetical protein